MQLIRGINNVPGDWSGCVVTIGNFDGVHLGHQHLLAHGRQAKVAMSLPLVAILFEPHPREFFSATMTPQRISSLRDKVSLLAEQGVDAILCLRFDKAFAAMTAEEFIRQVLVEKLKIKHCVIGGDFQFGHQRKGNVALLQRHGLEQGYTVECVDFIKRDGRKIGSTWIREGLLSGEFSDIQHLLGRPYQISGRVCRGDQRGREWGFPTINLRWPFKQPTLQGIFAVNVLGLGDLPLTGAASVGCRPTVDGKQWNIEVHLLDYDQDCYGRVVTVQFLKWFREEVRFDSVELLKQQIARDVENIREYFGLEIQPVTIAEASSL